jgi:ribosomal protein S18 acetylase RimI-like enzyme
MNYTYKNLTISDISILKQLLQVFGEAFEDLDSYQKAIPSDEYLSTLLAKPTFIALVAMDGEEVVGGLAAYVLEKFEQERSEVYIYDLAVAEPHRKRGIATKLINNLKPIAKEKNAYVIYVQADPPDLPAVKLYESLGVKEEVFHFDIPVDTK